MNFFKHHLGDYASATDHLSWDEDMAYTRLMRVYYRDEKPLPLDLSKVCRLARANGRKERHAIESVLNEFFVQEEDGWHNKRCDEEVAQAKAQSDINRKIAANRPRLVNGSSHHSSNGSSTNGSPLQTPDSNIQTPIPTPTPPKGGADRHRRSPERADRDRALEAWTEVVSKEGATDDLRARQAMRAIGGYSRIRLRTIHEESQIRSEFINAYRGAPETGAVESRAAP